MAVRRGGSCVEELQGDEGALVVFDSEEPVVAPSPFGRPVSEWGVKTERRVALRPVLDDIPPRLASWTTAPVGIANGDVRYDESCCRKGARRGSSVTTGSTAATRASS